LTVAAVASEVLHMEQLVLLVEELVVVDAVKRGDEDAREAASSSSPRRQPPDVALARLQDAQALALSPQWRRG
jgi:hypothetical protein